MLDFYSTQIHVFFRQIQIKNKDEKLLGFFVSYPLFSNFCRFLVEKTLNDILLELQWLLKLIFCWNYSDC